MIDTPHISYGIPNTLNLSARIHTIIGVLRGQEFFESNIKKTVKISRSYF